MFITYRMAEDAGACSEGLDWFHNNYPDGADHEDLIVALKAADEHGYADWLESEVDSGTFTNQIEEINTTMQISTQPQPFTPVTVTSKEQLLQLANDIQSAPKVFTPVTVTFNSESEFQDVVAALAAYGRKSVSVSGTGIADALNLTKYTGNARRTVNALLPQLQEVIG